MSTGFSGAFCHCLPPPSFTTMAGSTTSFLFEIWAASFREFAKPIHRQDQPWLALKQLACACCFAQVVNNAAVLVRQGLVTKASYASWSSSCFSKEYARGWIRGFPDTIRLNPPPWRLVTLRSWVQPPLRPSSQKQWYLQCFLHYRAVKPR